MSDRHAAYVVTLAEDINDGTAQDVITALGVIRGVIDVRPVAGSTDIAIAQARADREWRDRILGLLQGEDQ